MTVIMALVMAYGNVAIDSAEREICSRCRESSDMICLLGGMLCVCIQSTQTRRLASGCPQCHIPRPTVGQTHLTGFSSSTSAITLIDVDVHTRQP
jgi:hypothetical protein